MAFAFNHEFCLVDTPLCAELQLAFVELLYNIAAMLNAIQKALVRFLLGLYVIAVFQPLFPYVEYALNRQFIARQLCENRARPELNCAGRCYLNKQLAKTEAPRPPAPLPQKQHREWDALHLNVSETALAHFAVLHLLPHYVNFEKPSTSFTAEIFHPPRLALS